MIYVFTIVSFFDNPDQKFTNLRNEQFEISEFIINHIDSIYDSFFISF